MLNWWSTRKWSALVLSAFALLFAVLVWIGSHSPSYTQCAYDNDKNASQKEKNKPYYHVAIFFDCEVWVLNTNSGAGTAVATAFLVWITYLLVRLGREQSSTTRAQLRAYVKASHLHPGIMWTSRGIGGFDVGIRIKNFGQTPAEITDTLFTYEILPTGHLPPMPNYGPPENGSGIRALLVVNDEFNRAEAFEMAGATRNTVRGAAAPSRLIVFGYVDYIDVFGQRHRSGYARTFDPSEPENNLLMITERGWNYDRLRRRGEGRDWDDE